ncbi:MAG: hydroxyisourate hydrolase [Chitinophagaceae bacterium]
MSHITSHILDITRGRPALGVPVILLQLENDDWKQIGVSVTGNDGRVSDLVADDIVLKPGIFKLKFLTKEYFERFSTATFYPFIEIAFELLNEDHYHIPLLLTPFGYTSYRGS